MEKLTKATTAATFPDSARVIHRNARKSDRPGNRVAHAPGGQADIYSHLQWIGPGTFLVAAYIHKQSRR